MESKNSERLTQVELEIEQKVAKINELEETKQIVTRQLEVLRETTRYLKGETQPPSQREPVDWVDHAMPQASGVR